MPERRRGESKNAWWAVGFAAICVSVSVNTAGAQARIASLEERFAGAERAVVAEARSVFEARVAERRIMHQSKTVSVFDPQELEVLHDELRRDLAHFESDRDARIRKIKGE